MLIEFERYPGVKWLFNQIPPHIGKRMLTVCPTNCPLVNFLLVLSQIRTKYRELRGKAGFWLPPVFPDVIVGALIVVTNGSHFTLRDGYYTLYTIYNVYYTCKWNIYKRFSCANRWNCTHAEMGRNQEFSEVDEAIVVPSVQFLIIAFDFIFSYDCHKCLWLKLYG